MRNAINHVSPWTYSSLRQEVPARPDHFMFLFCLVFAMSLCASVYMCFVVTCWERADLLALVCGVYCESVTFPLVSSVRCGTWLYRFLIFAPLLFSIAFNRIPHERLMKKLEHYGIRDNIHRRIRSFLTVRTQQVLVEGATSDSTPVISVVPQGKWE